MAPSQQQPGAAFSRGRQLGRQGGQAGVVQASASDNSVPAPVPPPSGFLSTPEQQQAAYNVLLAVYGVLGLTFTLAPGWAVSSALQVPATPTLTGLMGVFASYFYMAMAALASLKEAATHGRLASDTYKRLNLGMMYWCITLIILQLRFSSVTNPALLGGYLLVCGSTILTCANIYKHSNGGLFSIRTILGNFLAGVKEALRPANTSAAVYSVLIAIYAVSWAMAFVTNAHPLFLGDIGVLGQYMKRKVGSGLLLAGIVHFVLKDAADRGRLGASTFRLLNLSIALYSVVGGWYFYQMWALGVPVWEPFMIALLVMAGVSVIWCDWQYFFAKK
eukprot:CAMPEP_0202902816 /NCGR_PEP_ID=MMETSP1392-20130828/17065_1 /ASSEMBLY_ACC=CAM_ASM_000868 /TAXON_ID=225041 /ORGANISM="Chlamydomonas chlamydogama, Strain SAG 11-48b" /LENGTH=332 /DNA_ID=CAMNT_0049589623 /DNA_START=275 /DNA_END=1273 /DNA_ORIENTATION=-